MVLEKCWGVDCLGPKGLPRIEDGVVDLIIADPPYWGVVKEDWDNQWSSEEEYVAWCQKWIDECWRTLRIGGAMWLFGYFRNLIGVLAALDKDKWVIKQQIVIYKGRRATARRDGKTLKMCPTATESVILLVKKGIVDVLKGCGLSAVEANKRLGQQTRGGGLWSRWMHEKCTPNREQLEKLGIGSKVWQTWNKIQGLTDVWDDIDFYNLGVKRRHPTQKPGKLMERLLELSSCAGDLVVDPFMGSGILGDVCDEMGRNYIGFEIGEKEAGGTG